MAGDPDGTVLGSSLHLVEELFSHLDVGGGGGTELGVKLVKPLEERSAVRLCGCRLSQLLMGDRGNALARHTPRRGQTSMRCTGQGVLVMPPPAAAARTGAKVSEA
jgi:hypothetical protein